MGAFKILYLTVTAFFVIIVKNMLPTQEEGGYIYFSDEEDVIHKIHIVDKTDKMAIPPVNSGDIIFWLCTRDNPNPTLINYVNHTEKATKIDPNKVTVVIIHGWLNDKESPVNTELTKAFLQNGNVNVIIVDWSRISQNIYYIEVALAVPEVGKYVGTFIEWLIDIGISFDKIHVVGFSLGAHVAGNAGRATGSKIQRITGLDPAAPMFDKSTKAHLVKTDAQYVEVIHTNAALYGVYYACGHADFFPNGGICMPGCVLNMCSHSQAYYYMAQSVKNNNMTARECHTMVEVEQDTCKGDPYPMGNSDLSKNRTGLFRVNTPAQTDYWNVTSEEPSSDMFCSNS